MPKTLTQLLPQDVDAIEMAFPANVSHLMPAYEDIPEEFKGYGDTKWLKFQSDWFCSGIRKIQTAPKPGIDATKAMNHLTCIQGSFEPKHQHKVAAVAYLASLWFDDVKYQVVKKKRR